MTSTSSAASSRATPIRAAQRPWATASRRRSTSRTSSGSLLVFASPDEARRGRRPGLLRFARDAGGEGTYSGSEVVIWPRGVGAAESRSTAGCLRYSGQLDQDLLGARGPLAATAVAHRGVTRRGRAAPEDDPHRARGLVALELACQARARVLGVGAGRLDRELELAALELVRALRRRAREVPTVPLVPSEQVTCRPPKTTCFTRFFVVVNSTGGALRGNLAEIGAGLEGSLGQGGRA